MLKKTPRSTRNSSARFKNSQVRPPTRLPSLNEMKKCEIIDRSRQFAEPYCVSSGKKFRLKDFDPAGTGKATSEDKPRAKELSDSIIQRRTGSSRLGIRASAT